jgi:Fe-S cluster biogenesis protein NfuA
LSDRLVKARPEGYLLAMISTKSKAELMQEIEAVLDQLREGLALHRGGVDLVDLNMETGVATVRMKGMCVGCSMGELTLKAGIEEAVRMMVPEVTEVANEQPLSEACVTHEPPLMHAES